MSRGRQGQGGLFGIVGEGVSFVSEYNQHRKAQKSAQQGASSQTSQEEAGHDPAAAAASGSASVFPQSYSPAIPNSPPSYNETVSQAQPADRSFQGSTSQENVEAPLDENSLPIDDDEETWALDDSVALSGVSPPDYTETDENQSLDNLISEVLATDARTHSLTTTVPTTPTTRQPLPCPVIIPQRRPGNKSRGFVRAYAPLLGSCAGISEETFLTFLKNFHKCSQASPYFAYVQIAAGIVGCVPEPITRYTAMAVQAAATVGASAHERYRTNAYLDKVNDELFRPAGLFAMIVKYESAEDAAQQVVGGAKNVLARFGVGSQKVVLSTNQTIAKYTRDDAEASGGGVGGATRSLSQQMQNLRTASASTSGAWSIPESAPLVFPDIDRMMAEQNPQGFKGNMKDFGKFVNRYMDKRAQRKYAQNDPDSSLVLPEEQFASRSKYSDPSHPIYNGGAIGFITGGALSDKRCASGSRSRSAGRYDQGPRQQDDQYYHQQGGYGRRLGGSSGGVGGPIGHLLGGVLNRGGSSARPDGRLSHAGYDDGYSDDGYGRSARSGGRGPIGHLLGGRMNRGGRTGGSYGADYADDGYRRHGRGGGGHGGPIGHLLGGRGGGRSARYDDAPPRGARRDDFDRQRGYYEDDLYADGDEYDRREPMLRDYGYDQRAETQGSGYGAGYGSSSRGGRAAGRGAGAGGSPVKRMMKSNVLYLMIVNMPSEEELAEARATLAQAN